MADLHRQLDTRIEIITPENISFSYRLAGPFRRVLAYLIDVVIRIVIVTGLLFGSTFVLGPLHAWGFGVGIALVAWFVLDWFYGGVFETLWNGQTIGKRALHIRVIAIEGQPITAAQAVLRNFLRAADAMPTIVVLPLYQLGLLAAASNERFQRLGDLAAGTMVVIEEPTHQYAVLRINEPEAVRLAGQIPASFVPARSLARALSRYVQRRKEIPIRRRMEIAWHLAEPLRIKLNLPANTNPDLLLCAVYHRTFITDRWGAEMEASQPESFNPFAWQPTEPTWQPMPDLGPARS